jgi:stage II sporulation protein D
MFWAKSFMLASLLALACAQAVLCFPAEVTVELFRAKPPPDRMTIIGPFRLQGTRTYSTSDVRALGGGRVQMGNTVSRSIVIPPSPGGTTLAVQDARRRYLGTITITVGPNGKLVIRNTLPARDYVRSVVGSETTPEFSLEALKAQAVCTQTLLARYHPSDALTDTTEKQAYLGADYVRPAAKQAVDAVFGKVLLYKDVPASIYFHAACAGGTSDGEQYFHLKKGSAPYLRGVKCDHCKNSPFTKPKISLIPIKVYASRMGSELPQITDADKEGRPLKVVIGSKSMPGFTFWTEIGKQFGWDKVPGTRFSCTPTATDDMYFCSTGGGHGVGLCQSGADGLARLGKSYEDILGYYFPGALVSDVR